TAFEREDRVRRDVDRRPQPRHPEHRALLHARGHFDLHPPSAGQLDSPACAAVRLGQADGDRALHVDGLLLADATARRVAEDRAEDVAEATAFAEEVFHVLGRDGAVLHPRPRAAAWAGATRLAGPDARGPV